MQEINDGTLGGPRDSRGQTDQINEIEKIMLLINGVL